MSNNDEPINFAWNKEKHSERVNKMPQMIEVNIKCKSPDCEKKQPLYMTLCIPSLIMSTSPNEKGFGLKQDITTLICYHCGNKTDIEGLANNVRESISKQALTNTPERVN